MKQQDLVDRQIQTEIKAFLAEEYFSAVKIKEAEVFSWWSSN